MIILGLDCATKTGWALIEDGEILESGVQDFTKRRGESNGILFLRFRQWLVELLKLWRPEVVVYERANHRGGAATEICVGLTTRVEEYCAALSIHHAAVSASEVKRLAAGSGRADKAAMVEAAAVVLGRPPLDDNEADAVHVARWGWDQFAPEAGGVEGRTGGGDAAA